MLLRIPEAGQLLGLGRTTMYELIGAGEVEVVHIGRAARIPFDSVERFVDRLRSVSHTCR
ncbi:MAG TPA: transcriptional regulator [Acidimicrobiaceae bacterium]|nr:transcriptional regulator [Acidimicrobiaceae bacterium]